MKKICAAIMASLIFTPLAFAKGWDKQQKQQEQRVQAQMPVEKAEVDKINNEYKNFIGKRVQVEGEVEDVVLQDQSFILEGDSWLNNDILIVSQGKIVNLKDMADEDKRVSVTGTVKRANFYEIENDLDNAINPELELDKKKGVTYILLDNFQSGELAE